MKGDSKAIEWQTAPAKKNPKAACTGQKTKASGAENVVKHVIRITFIVSNKLNSTPKTEL